VSSGRLSAERIRTSAERILRAKARLGLHVRAGVPLGQVDRVVGDPEVEGLAEVIARRAITVVRNEGEVLPLGEGMGIASPDTGRYGESAPPRAEGPFLPKPELQPVLPDSSGKGGVLLLGLSSDPGSGGVGGSFFRRLAEIFPESPRLDLYPDYGQRDAREALAAVESASVVVAAVFSRVRDQKGHAAVIAPHAALIGYAAELGKKVVVVAFGPPYFLRQFPHVDSYVAAYDYSDLAQRAAAEVVVGEVGARGRLPVSIPGLYPMGWGINVGPAAGR
jgi:beta-N-acetylhexosaminidase